MRVAFVGKGGSGKSTVTTLFFLYLINQKSPVLCVDADLNIHIPNLLGIEFPKERALSDPKNTRAIREYLKGTSKHIQSIDHVYKTTPPSTGVQFVTLDQENPIIQQYCVAYRPSAYLAIVGTYEKEEIGRSCYHTNLAIFENLLSFAKLKQNEWIIADMVAGIDAFSNTLHAQFDLLVLVVEPTKESIDVFTQYYRLAQHADISNRLVVVGNKIEDEDDETFLKTHIPSDIFIGGIPKYRSIKIQRQQGLPLTEKIFNDIDTTIFSTIEKKARALRQDPNDRLKRLHDLHRAYIQQDYVKLASGDLSHQIDPTFHF